MLEIVFMNFLASKLQDFYRRGINDLLDRWQRCMAVQGSYSNFNIKFHFKLYYLLKDIF